MHSNASTSQKLAEDEPPSDDLLCPLCKKIFTDAVITPCCGFSFCDACKFIDCFMNLATGSREQISFCLGIRNALIESPDHKCPHCLQQYVAIDQINPNFCVRNLVDRWHERQSQLSFSHLTMLQPHSQKNEMDVDNNTKKSSDSIAEQVEEYDPTTPSTPSELQPIAKPAKPAPIVIKMQSSSKSQSPPLPVLNTKTPDPSSEEEKINDDEMNSSRFAELTSFYFASTRYRLTFSQKTSQSSNAQTMNIGDEINQIRAESTSSLAPSERELNASNRSLHFDIIF